MDWIGLVIAALFWAITLRWLYLYGSFEVTGVRGWRRVWAGWRLLLDQVGLRLGHWAAQVRRQRGG